jgi:Ca2+-binding RTX toxin-like protein
LDRDYEPRRRAGDTLSNIDTIDFHGVGQQTLELNSSQFGVGLISTSVTLTASAFLSSPGSLGQVEVFLNPADTSFSVANWQLGTVASGNQQPAAIVDGQFTTGAVTLTGGDHIQTALVAGTGADTMQGGAAGTIFIFGASSAPLGDVVNAGSGGDEVDVAGGSSVNLTGVSINNVHTLSFDFAGGTATLAAGQLGPAGITTITDLTAGSSPGGNETLIVHGSNVNLSGLTLSGWQSSDRVILDNPGSNQQIVGAPGNNTIHAGSGNNTLTGGSGDNTFVFDSAVNKHIKPDHITNFVHVEDEIALSHQVFGHHLKVTQQTFEAGPQAHHATNHEQHIIYNTKTGALYYQRSEAAQPVEFAVVDHHPHLKPHDFIMVA